MTAAKLRLAQNTISLNFYGRTAMNHKIVHRMRARVLRKHVPRFRYRRFKYQYPDSIRVLKFQPSPTSSSAIYCKLIHKTLSEYDGDLLDNCIALSYVWGSLDHSQPIVVNSYVTQNLKNALCHLQDETRVVMLWVDAICLYTDRS